MSILCPFCEGQGEIYRAVVRQTKETIYICDECDTVWLTEQIEEDRATHLESYMSSRALPACWCELERVEKL
ncbi:MAG: hypothetical protein CSB19_02425 [Clostridiales bacterium]|nr:MAG: hypothetical protein CSB19_02425 [Clostridiales bacterium]